MKNFLLLYPYLAWKHQLCQNYTIFPAQKVNRILFFFNFEEKISALMSIFCRKNVHSLKKHAALIPIFYSKNVHSPKNAMLSCHFSSSFSWKTPCCHDHIWSKNLNSVKITLYYIQAKNTTGCPFVLSCPYFVQKTSIL